MGTCDIHKVCAVAGARKGAMVHVGMVPEQEISHQGGYESARREAPMNSVCGHKL